MPVEAKLLGAHASADVSLAEIATRRDEILEQLSRILASPHFKHSRQYPALLRYVVEQTLNGNAAALKERALGIAVFHRDADYDTNLDPVVRTCACEIRKRLAHYYQESGRGGELRIDLPPGSYHPEFHFPLPPAPPGMPAAPPAPVLAFVRRARSHSPWWVLVASGLVPLALAVGAVRIMASNPLDQFWAPVFGAGDSALIAISHPSSQTRNATSRTMGEVMQNDAVAFADALAMARVAALIRVKGKRFDIRRPANITLNDLRRSAVVLIGGFNNPWTMRLDEHLRFYFDRDPQSHIALIRDRKNPARTLSKGSDDDLYSSIKEDYAIVSRYVDPLTEKEVVTVAGIGKDGTLAAGEFVTEPKYLEQLAARAPANWRRHNLQAVIATEIVNGIPGPPRILDQYFW
jgi:hypothetical protein